MRAVLETYSLGMMRLKGDIIRIDTLDNIKNEKEKLERIRQNAENLIPTRILVVRLSYAKAPDVVNLVSAMIGAGGGAPAPASGAGGGGLRETAGAGIGAGARTGAEL